jgi:hypothetical protein
MVPTDEEAAALAIESLDSPCSEKQLAASKLSNILDPSAEVQTQKRRGRHTATRSDQCVLLCGDFLTSLTGRRR